MSLSKQHYELYELTRDVADSLLSIECAELNERDSDRYIPSAKAKINALRDWLNKHETSEVVKDGVK